MGRPTPKIDDQGRAWYSVKDVAELAGLRSTEAVRKWVLQGLLAHLDPDRPVTRGPNGGYRIGADDAHRFLDARAARPGARRPAPAEPPLDRSAGEGLDIAALERAADRARIAELELQIVREQLAAERRVNALFRRLAGVLASENLTALEDP